MPTCRSRRQANVNENPDCGAEIFALFNRVRTVAAKSLSNRIVVTNDGFTL